MAFTEEEQGAPRGQRASCGEAAPRGQAASSGEAAPREEALAEADADEFDADVVEGKHGDMRTAEEDLIIDIGVRVQGLRWRAIAEKLPGRSESGCRNRWVRNQQRLLAQAGQPVQGTRAVCAALAAAGMMRQR